MKKFYAVLFATALFATVGVSVIVTGGKSATNGSSADRTVYSAVYALKHKNFGRFCSYLSQDLRSTPEGCALNTAAGWGQNAVLWGMDIFDHRSNVVPGYRADVDDDTVTYLVSFPALEDPAYEDAAYYRFTVELQDSGKWRISKIESVPNLPDEAQRVASYGAKADVS